MPRMADGTREGGSGGSAHQPFFPATHWTEIAVLRDPQHPEAAEALESLCRTYLPAIERYLRWYRDLPGDPHELANEFLGQFIHQDSLRRVDRTKGRFRNYVAGSIRHFLQDKWRATVRQPRHVEIDDDHLDPATARDAASEFDRGVAEILVGQAVAGTRAHFAGTRIESQIPHLLPYLGMDPPEETLRQLAARLAVSQDVIYQNYRRVRTELSRRLRAEVRRHLGPDDDVDAEIQALFKAFARPPA